MSKTPKQMQACNQRWATIKPEAFNLYIQQDMQLKETMATIKITHDFNASLRMWKLMLKEWGYKKNISTNDMKWIVAKAEKRKLEDKDTIFFFNDIEIKKERIENFKRRKSAVAPFGIATPPNVTYGTPIYVHSNESESEELSDESVRSASFSMSNSIAALDGSNGPHHREEVQIFSMLDQYLEDPNQPWSSYKEVSSTRYTEQHDGIYPTPALEIRDAIFYELRCLQYQIKCKDSVMGTLDEEAENDCLMILDQGGPQVMVQTFLGIVYLNASSVRKATSSLCLALTEFILQFTANTLESNSADLEAIDDLFSRLASQNEQEWSSLALCIRQITSTLAEAFHSGTIDLVSPKLLLHGISFARQLYRLEDMIETNYVEEMYESLLKYSSGKGFFLYEIEFATAHHEYALLLKKKGKWLECAEQLIQAYQFTIYNESRNSQLIACLKYECLDILQHFSARKDESVILDKITRTLTSMDRKNQDNSEDGQLSRLREYLQSDLPFTLKEDLERVSIDTCLPAHEVGKETGKTSTSSNSMSLSHKYGLTFSESDITGISNSEFYTAD